MKKSNEIHLISNGDDISDVLNEAAEFSKSINLSNKDTLRVRLLTEETMGMIKTLTGEVELKLSFIAQPDECIICVETDTEMSALKKDDLLSVSSSGENVLAKGIMGKIRDVFETAFLMPLGDDFSDYAPASLMDGMTMNMYSGHLMDVVYWNLESYKSNVKADKDSPDQVDRWDELEKSIVSNIASDVQVGIKNGHVVMNIIYKLTN